MKKILGALSILVTLAACNEAAVTNQAAAVAPAIQPAQPTGASISVHSNVAIKDSNGNALAYVLTTLGEDATVLTTDGAVQLVNIWSGQFEVNYVLTLYATTDCSGTPYASSVLPHQQVEIGGQWYSATGHVNGIGEESVVLQSYFNDISCESGTGAVIGGSAAKVSSMTAIATPTDYSTLAPLTISGD